MTITEIKQELSATKKPDLLWIIEELMQDGVIDITDINLCHTRALEAKLAAKEDIIQEADTYILRSVFTDSLGKPASEKDTERKLAWLEKTGNHNMDGIQSCIEENVRTWQKHEHE